MASGCIPIGSAVGAIPEIIESTGLILGRKEITDLEAMIQGFDLPKFREFSAAASLRIQREFNFAQRKIKLLTVLALA